MHILGAILLVIAVVTIIFHVLAKKKISAILSSREVTIGELQSQYETITEELGAEGGFEEMVTLRGAVECPEPIYSPLAEEACLYFHMKISRKSEETVERRDSDGDTRIERRTHTDTMSTESRHCPFTLVNGEDSLPVRLDGASYDRLTETVNRFDPGEDTGLLGRFNISLGMGSSHRRTLGYQYEEQILPINQELTVVGQVKSDGKGLSVGRGGLAFIVSPRTRGELLGSAESTARFTAIGSGVLALAGVASLVAGLLG